MSDLTRRELARACAWLLAGLATGARSSAAKRRAEIDAPGGLDLLRSVSAGDLEAVFAAAQPLARELSARRVRQVLALAGPQQSLVADLDPSGYRLTLLTPLGGVTVAGSPAGVSRVTARPRRASPRGARDTAIQGAGGVSLVSSSALAQRRLTPRFHPGAVLPAAYDRFAWVVARHLERVAVRPTVRRR